MAHPSFIYVSQNRFFDRKGNHGIMSLPVRFSVRIVLLKADDNVQKNTDPVQPACIGAIGSDIRFV